MFAMHKTTETLHLVGESAKVPLVWCTALAFLEAKTTLRQTIFNVGNLQQRKTQ